MIGEADRRRIQCCSIDANMRMATPHKVTRTAAAISTAALKVSGIWWSEVPAAG
jgi:hypothetical protein